MTHYAYDAVGRRTRRTTPTGGHRVDFTHDAAGRELARVFGDAVTVTSAWDEAGRPSEQHISAGGRAVNTRACATAPTAI
ncbi:hypothetical protein [Streptomyces sp. NRRL S-244]|uniref:hypothetical protein n=1 Tax=Streptomyces sp. NRRL S-244 TaxID=1463897 RepID=UPI0004BF2F4A|nr:hypothetical protein [Streptomyces sp. NRRL S-244]